LAVFHERLQAADEKLLKAGNFTRCESIERIKKAAVDYRTECHVDEDVYRECRILSYAYRSDDVTSGTVEG